jgi:hypothetical protein
MCKSFSDVERQAAEYRHSIERQSAEQYARTQLQISESRLSQERQAAEYKLGLELDAHRNREAIQRQLAECCCEIKERVLTTSCETKELVRHLNNDRYRDGLIEARQEIALLRALAAARDPCPQPDPRPH